MLGTRLAGIALLLLLLLLLLPAVSAAEATVYHAQHRPAEELLHLAEAALGERGHAVVDANTNSLVLLGDPAAVAETLSLLAAQDRPARSVVIHYEERRLSELRDRGAEVRWSVGEGELRVGNVEGAEAPGVEVTTRDLRAGASGDHAGTLRVLDGGSGRITTGRVVPVRTERHDGRHDTLLVSADTGFEVTPRILGDGRVQLDLVPFGAEVLPDGSIATSGAATRVVLEPDGEPLVIGGIARELGTASESTLSGRREASSSDERVLLVRVEVD